MLRYKLNMYYKFKHVNIFLDIFVFKSMYPTASIIYIYIYIYIYI